MAVPPEPTMPTKITEPMRSALLRRPLSPSVTRDCDIAGLALHVTTRRGFWAISYQPRGRNPITGKRWGGGTRHELGDAQLIGVAEARGLALAAKAVVRAGGDPHRERMASRASAEAERAVVPQTVAEALGDYDRAMMARRQPSEWTRKQSVRYALLACTSMNALCLPIAAIDARMVRIMVETAPGADAQRRHIFGGLNRFLGWCRRQGLIEHNPCADLDRDERPKPGRPREHVPSVATLRAIWSAAESEQACPLLRFLLLLPLRRNEASGLTWREVDLEQGRIRIAARRMKAGELHELPLSPPALAILKALKAGGTSDLVFPSSEGKPFVNWVRLLARIRGKIGEGAAGKADRFSLHDIRRAFVTAMAERGFDVDLLDQCLSHTRKGVLGVYQRAFRMADRKRALDTWAALITGAEADSTIVPFARRANV
jgi:integrase